MTYYHDSDAEEERWNARMKEIKTEMSRQQRYYQALAEEEEKSVGKNALTTQNTSEEPVQIYWDTDRTEDLNGCLWVLIGFVAIMAVCYYSYIWMGGSIIW